MFPGVILQMTYWYRPDEMSLRLLYFCRSTTTKQSKEQQVLIGLRYLRKLLRYYRGPSGFRFRPSFRCCGVIRLAVVGEP